MVIDKDKWYEYDGNDIFCGKCVIESLNDKTLAPHERMDTDKLYILSSDELNDGVQCDGCLEQSENYPDNPDNLDTDD